MTCPDITSETEWFDSQPVHIAWLVAIPLASLHVLLAAGPSVLSLPFRILNWIRKGGFWQWIIVLFTLYCLIGGGLNNLRIHFIDASIAKIEKTHLENKIESFQEPLAFAKSVQASLDAGAVLINNQELVGIVDESGSLVENIADAKYHLANSNLLFEEFVTGIVTEYKLDVSSDTAVKRMNQYFCFKQTAEAYNCDLTRSGSRWEVASHVFARSALQMKSAATSESIQFTTGKYKDRYKITADLTLITRVGKNPESIYGLDIMYQRTLGLAYLKSWSEINKFMKLTPAQVAERNKVKQLIISILEGKSDLETYTQTYARHCRCTFGADEYKNITRSYNTVMEGA